MNACTCMLHMYYITSELMITIEKCSDILENNYLSISLEIDDFGQTFVNFDRILSCVLCCYHKPCHITSTPTYVPRVRHHPCSFSTAALRRPSQPAPCCPGSMGPSAGCRKLSCCCMDRCPGRARASTGLWEWGQEWDVLNKCVLK